MNNCSFDLPLQRVLETNFQLTASTHTLVMDFLTLGVVMKWGVDMLRLCLEGSSVKMQRCSRILRLQSRSSLWSGWCCLSLRLRPLICVHPPLVSNRCLLLSMTFEMQIELFSTRPLNLSLSNQSNTHISNRCILSPTHTRTYMHLCYRHTNCGFVIAGESGQDCKVCVV